MIAWDHDLRVRSVWPATYVMTGSLFSTFFIEIGDRERSSASPSSKEVEVVQVDFVAVYTQP